MPQPPLEQSGNYWFARHSKSIIFLVCILTVVGVYEALTLPVAVFPTTNFPRIIVGVDNGVTPIEQMEASITRPLEEAVRTVPGLEDVRSVTGRGAAEIDLFFNWRVDMLETLQLVDAAVSRVQSSLPPTAQIQTHRLDFSSFPIIGYSLTSARVPQRPVGAGDLRNQAAVEPAARRRKRARAGRTTAGISRHRRSRADAQDPDLDRRRRVGDQQDEHHRLPWPVESQPSALPRAWCRPDSDARGTWRGCRQTAGPRPCA